VLSGLIYFAEDVGAQHISYSGSWLKVRY